MRTVDAELTAALAAGTGVPYVIGYIGYAGGAVKHSEAVYSYKLTGTTLEFWMPYHGDFASDQTHIWLERGVEINGTSYTITTGRFSIHSQEYGDDTYENVITAFCTAMNKTAVFRDPTQAWLDYQFMADGERIDLGDAPKFL